MLNPSIPCLRLRNFVSIMHGNTVFEEDLIRPEEEALVWEEGSPCTEWIPQLLNITCITSDFIRRSKCGARSLCNLAIWSSLFNKENSLSNSSSELNISGVKKFNRWNNSTRAVMLTGYNHFELFCNGVPVSRTLWLVLNVLRTLKSLELLFFNRCASSTTKTPQLNAFSEAAVL